MSALHKGQIRMVYMDIKCFDCRPPVFLTAKLHAFRLIWSRKWGAVRLPAGPRFNIKMLFYQYRKYHWGDKTVVRLSYLHNGISYTGKMWSLYWFIPQVLYSLSGKTSYQQISLSFEAAKLGVIMIVSLWNVTGISAAVLPRYLSHFRAIGKV